MLEKVKDFIFSSEKKDNNIRIKILGIKMQFSRPIQGNNNKIYIEKDGKLEECKGKIKGLKIEITGDDNTIIIGYPYKFTNSHIFCRGDNNEVIIKKTKHIIQNLTIDMCARVYSNRKVFIGEDVFTNGIIMLSYAPGGIISIGNQCMLSWGIVMMSSDGHQILDKNTDEIINAGYCCEVGNHVWIAQNSIICKNVKIADNNIIGANSVVTKSVAESYVTIAGSPAKIVKRDVKWKMDNG